MRHITEEAADVFNRVMNTHSIDLKAIPSDFTITNHVALLRGPMSDRDLSEELFDKLFPPLESGIYYNYQTIEAFEALATNKTLRLYSTKKKSSEGEFITLCKDLGLDGYWREGDDGKAGGCHEELMDELYYKSFVACPKTSAEKLWEVFADKGRGVRIKVQIEIADGYPDFRRMAYQESEAFHVLSELRNGFLKIGRHLVNGGLSRMPGYYQLKDFSYQNECRLLAKRFQDSGNSVWLRIGDDYKFPFEVRRDEDQNCNYIDCSLEPGGNPWFQLSILDVEKGPKCDSANFGRIYTMLEQWWQKP